MTLTEFLLARIAEDEAYTHEALAAASIYDQSTVKWHRFVAHSRGGTWHPTPANPARVLAECEAKRRIVEQTQSAKEAAEHALMDFEDGYAIAHNNILELLALPYADHEDYREEWKP